MPGNVFSYDATALVRACARLLAVSNYSPWALGESLASLERHLRRLPFERVVSHTYPIDQISEAFRQADWLSHGGDPLRVFRAAIAC